MPVGINVEDDPRNPGFVLIEFADSTLKGKSLQTLIAAGGPEIVEPLTREKGSERTRYRVPEGNAVAAGLIEGSGTDLDDITQRGPADATGMVQPPVHTIKNHVVAPVVRKGTYKDGYGNNVTSSPADPVGQPPAEPTQAELAEYVNTHQKSLREREGRGPGTPPVSPFVGFADTSPVDDTTPAQAVHVADGGTETPLTPDADGMVTLTSTPDEPPAEPVELVKYPTDSLPSMNWSRAELDAFALQVKNIDTSIKSEYPSKSDVLAVITAPPTA